MVREIFRNLVTAEGTRAARRAGGAAVGLRGAAGRGGSRARRAGGRPSPHGVRGGLRGHVHQATGPMAGSPAMRSHADDGPGVEPATASRNDTGHRRIEIVHESLLTHWPRLERWRTQDADGRARSATSSGRPRTSGTSGDDRTTCCGPGGRTGLRRWRGALRRRSLSALEDGVRAGHDRSRRQAEAAAAPGFRHAPVAASGSGRDNCLALARSETSRQKADAETQRAEASKLLALGQRRAGDVPTAALAYALKSLELADTEAGRLFALRVLQHAPTMILAPAGREQGLDAHSAAFSPNGDWLALGGTSKVQLLHRDGRNPLVLGDYAGQDGVHRSRFRTRERPPGGQPGRRCPGMVHSRRKRAAPWRFRGRSVEAVGEGGRLSHFDHGRAASSPPPLALR